MSDSPNEMRLQILLSYPELSVENALRRMCHIAVSMHEDAIQVLRNPKSQLAQDVIALDDEVDRFSLYIIRQLKSAVQNERVLRDVGFSNAIEFPGYRITVKSVERIADHAVKIAEVVLTLRREMNAPDVRRISEMSIFAKSIFDDSIKSLHMKDYALADRVVARAEGIAQMESRLLQLFPDMAKPAEIAA